MDALLAPMPTPCLACCDGMPKRHNKWMWRVRKSSGLETRMSTSRVYTQAVAHVTAQLQAMQSGKATYVWIRKRFERTWYEGYITYQEPWFEAVYTDGDREDIEYSTALELATAWIKHACLHEDVDDEQQY